MILQGLNSVIRRYSEAVTITRPGSTTYDATGAVVASAATTINVLAHVERPAGPRDLLHLPEGDRVRRSCAVWSPVELQHRDVVTLGDGEQFELQSIEPWHLVARFWRAIGLKVQPQ